VNKDVSVEMLCQLTVDTPSSNASKPWLPKIPDNRTVWASLWIGPLRR